jgi:hypothetical protein
MNCRNHPKRLDELGLRVGSKPFNVFTFTPLTPKNQFFRKLDDFNKVKTASWAKNFH